MRKPWSLFPILLLAACSLPLTIPDYKTATLTPASEQSPYTQCAWSWATQPLPDLRAEIQTALDGAGLKEVTVTAEAYGENCITGTGEVDHFATMETDFHFQVEVADLSNTIALGDLLERILVVLDSFPAEVTPGSQPGYIGVRFIQGNNDTNLWFNVTTSDSARALGLHGAELLSELQK